MLSFSTATFQVFVAVSAATTAPPTLSFALITANVGHSIVALVEAVALAYRSLLMEAELLQINPSLWVKEDQSYSYQTQQVK